MVASNYSPLTRMHDSFKIHLISFVCCIAKLRYMVPQQWLLVKHHECFSIIPSFMHYLNLNIILLHKLVGRDE